MHAASIDVNKGYVSYLVTEFDLYRAVCTDLLVWDLS